MRHTRDFFIDGRWVAPAAAGELPVINPANEREIARISLGGATDVDRAVMAARRAFETFSLTTVEERRALLARIIAVYERRSEEMAALISAEMGAPIAIARGSHVPQGLAHLTEAARTLETYAFETPRAGGLVVKEPIGVCALITPWNWPISLIACKVAPALAAGCAMVLKPSEVAPLNAWLFAEILDEAGVPPGVFNLVGGTGPAVGEALARHPEVDLVSITGSNRAGVAVAQAGSTTVKRIAQELGGKSACILLPDVDIGAQARMVANRLFRNSGQSCAAWTRLLVPEDRQDEAIEGAIAAAQTVIVGDPADPATTMGPVASRDQLERVRGFIRSGLQGGAQMVAGGEAPPEGLVTGYYVPPTVFANVTADMEIAREEIFGPVLCIMTWRDEEEAIQIANSTRYGLSGAVWSADHARATKLARRLRSGMVHINETQADYGAPFGGYKQSGNGREWGAYGLAEYLETKMLFGGR